MTILSEGYLNIDNIEHISTGLIKEIETLFSGVLNVVGSLVQFTIPPIDKEDLPSTYKLREALPKIQVVWEYINSIRYTISPDLGLGVRDRIMYNFKVINEIAVELRKHCRRLLYPIFSIGPDTEAYINYMSWYAARVGRINSVRYNPTPQ